MIEPRPAPGRRSNRAGGRVVEVADGNGQAATAALGPLLAGAPVETHHLSVELMMARSPDDVRAWWTPSRTPVTAVVLRNGLARPHGEGTSMSALAPQVAAETSPRVVAGERRATTRFASEIASELSVSMRVVRNEILMQRLEHVPAREPRGGARLALRDETDVLAQWMHAFDEETGSTPDRAFNVALVEHYIATGRLFVWEADGRPVAVAARFGDVRGVEEVKFVYTPPAERDHGFGAGIVSHVAASITADGRTCVLRADTSKPGPQRLYRKIGFVPVAEHVSIELA